MSTENLNFKVFDISSALRGLSDRDRKLRDSNPTSVLYLDDVYKLIEIKTSDKEVQKKLKEEAKSLPYKALGHFVSRLDHLIGIRMRQNNMDKYADTQKAIQNNPATPEFTQDDLVSMQNDLYNSLDNGDENAAEDSAENSGQDKTD